MAELSPAARAVLNAVEDTFSESVLSLDESPISTGAMSLMAAAALRAVADQVVPEENVDDADYDCLNAKWVATGKQETRADILSIAAELEGR